MYQWEAKVSKKSPEVPDCVQSDKENDKQTHKLHPQSPGKVYTSQYEPQPPGSSERPETTSSRERNSHVFTSSKDKRDGYIAYYTYIQPIEHYEEARFFLLVYHIVIIFSKQSVS